MVTRVERDKLTAIIELRAGRFRVVSLLTREAADALKLEEGDLATAVVKSTSVMMEVAARMNRLDPSEADGHIGPSPGCFLTAVRWPVPPAAVRRVRPPQRPRRPRS